MRHSVSCSYLAVVSHWSEGVLLIAGLCSLWRHTVWVSRFAVWQEYRVYPATRIGYFPALWSSLYFFLCGHRFAISVRLLRQSGLPRFRIINTFSDRQMSQSPLPCSYGRHFFSISHLIAGSGFRLLLQTYCDRVVAALLLSCLKLCVCRLYLVLKASSVLPIYSALALLCFRVAL